MALQPPFLSHAEAREVKLEVIRHAARLNRHTVSDALAWLGRRGYVTVHGRDARGTLSLSLAWALPDPDPAAPP